MIVTIRKKMIQLIPYNTYTSFITFKSDHIAKYISEASNVENVLKEPFTRELKPMRFQQ